MKICYIIGAGDPSPAFIDRDNAYIIAADGGLSHLNAIGITPDLTVGDYDSLGFVPQTGEVVTVPVEKDFTDTELAVRIGLEKGFDTFLLYGGTGGRPDHTFANTVLLTDLSKKGKRGYLIGNGFITTAVTDGAIRFEKKDSGTLSVFAAGDTAEGVTIRGFKYSLDHGSLAFSVPLGVSNAFIGEEGLISVENGTLIVMWEEKNLSAWIDKL